MLMKRLFVLVTGCLLTGVATAATVTVTSLSELTNAIAEANPGDRVVLSSGVYTAAQPIVITNKGTVRNPITIAAAAVGGTEIKGSAGFVLRSPATYVVIEGFRFTHEGPMTLGTGATHCRISRNLFQSASVGPSSYLEILGDDNEVDCNTFQNKRTEGPMVSIQGPGTNLMAQHNWLHHNYFYHFTPVANGGYALQVGLDSRSLSSAFVIAEFNFFEQAAGNEQGAICNLSSENIYRFNTFGKGTRQLSLQRGRGCQVNGNFFIGSEGLNVLGNGHRVYDNYFEGCNPAIHLGNAEAMLSTANPTRDRPEPAQVTFNTLINNKVNVTIARGEAAASGATNTVLANNIFVGGGKAVSIDGPVPKAKWEGNIIWNGTAGAGDLPKSGYLSVDPKLTLENPEKYHLQFGSPAIGKAIGGYTYVTQDIDRQPRKGKMDIGADGTAPRGVPAATAS